MEPILAQKQGTLVLEVVQMKLKPKMNHMTTGLIVAGLGATVAGAALFMKKSPIRDGAVGFGLAHVVLGALDAVVRD